MAKRQYNKRAVENSVEEKVEIPVKEKTVEKPVKKKITTREMLFVDVAHINSRIRRKEMLFLFDLAANVPEDGTILEVGSAFGGSSACLGLGSQNRAHLILIENFSQPICSGTSEPLLLSNLQKAGLTNFTLMNVDCMSPEFDSWSTPIDLLHIDGNHHFPYIWHDLTTFGVHAKVIACHDYDTIQLDIKPAVDIFCAEYPYMIDKTVETMICLVRK